MMRRFYLALLFVLFALTVGRLVYTRTGPSPPSLDNSGTVDPDVEALVSAQISRVNANRRDADRRFVLGQVYEANELHDLAVEAYQQVLEMDPNRAEAWFRCAVSQERQGKLDDAITSMDRAIALAPEFAPGYWRQALWLLDVGKIDEAAQRADAAVRLAPDDPSGWFAQARVHLARRQNQVAIDLIEKKKLTSGANGAYASFLLSTAYRQMGKTKEAQDYASDEEVRPVWRDSWTAELTRYHTGLSRMRANASGLVRAHRDAEAIGLLEQIAERDPSDYRSLNMLASCYLSQQRWEDCIRTFERAIQARPQHFNSRLNYAAALAMMHPYHAIDLQAALKQVDQAIQLRPSSAKAQAARAMLCEHAGQVEQAIAAYDQAFQLDAREPDFAVRAAGLLLRNGDRQQARARLLDLRERYQDSGAVYLILAQLLMADGNSTEAIEVLQRGLQASKCTPPVAKTMRQLLDQLQAAGSP